TPFTIYWSSYQLWEVSSARPPWTAVSSIYQHPNGANSGQVQWSDRRWTSPVSGMLHIHGHVAKADIGGGDGITAHIRIASSSTDLWTASLAYDDTVGLDFDIYTSVQAGTSIDFLVDPSANDMFDFSTLTALIGLR